MGSWAWTVSQAVAWSYLPGTIPFPLLSAGQWGLCGLVEQIRVSERRKCILAVLSDQSLVLPPVSSRLVLGLMLGAEVT